MLKSEKADLTLLSGFVNEFVIYSLAGWLYETVCESIFARSLVFNRGYLHLPICPIYGFGAFIALWIIGRFKSCSHTAIFVGGAAITTAIEYTAAILLENMLGKSLWDYSKWICNYQGRVSLISSLIFGIGCLGAYKLRPLMKSFAKGKMWLAYLAAAEVIIISMDFLYTSFFE